MRKIVPEPLTATQVQDRLGDAYYYDQTHVLNPETGHWDRARRATATLATRFVYDDHLDCWFAFPPSP